MITAINLWSLNLFDRRVLQFQKLWLIPLLGEIVSYEQIVQRKSQDVTIYVTKAQAYAVLFPLWPRPPRAGDVPLARFPREGTVCLCAWQRQGKMATQESQATIAASSNGEVNSAIPTLTFAFRFFISVTGGLFFPCGVKCHAAAV